MSQLSKSDYIGKVVEDIEYKHNQGYEPSKVVIRFTDGSTLTAAAISVSYDQFSSSPAVWIHEIGDAE